MASSGLAEEVVFTFQLREEGAEGVTHLLERRNSKSPSSEVGEDFTNL